MNRWKNKHVFVSGGAGVIGSALVNRLLEKEASIFVGDLKACPPSWKGLLQYRQGDLINLTIQEISEFSPEVFFHLAATFERTEETFEFWKENFHHNVHLSHHLMSLMKELSTIKKILFASSYLTYDSSLYLFPLPQKEAISLSERSAMVPRNLCGAAKWHHEQELAFLKHFIPHLHIISARIFRSYGIGSRDIISRWIKALLRKERIFLFCPEGCFDYIYADDIAQGIIKLAETEYSGAVNLGTGRARSVAEIIAILREHFPSMDLEQSDVVMPYEASQANMNLFHELTQSKKFRPIEEGISELILAQAPSIHL